ncbi:GIY-YIG nuclease family protein [Xanthobacter sp. V3C-3]|uniref:GIY-YIG nuclease family protein n=1 Tax=Xanthobacter lutulentifluminis TaxID=3119935 RepID=UPI0037288339
MKGEVYFAAMSTGDIKIGFSTDVAKRMGQLFYAVPGGVTLLASFLSTPDAEAWCHRKFSNLRVSGEWFRPDPELMDFIERVKREGNLVVPETFRAEEIELAPRLPTDEEVKHRAKFYIGRIAEPLRAGDKVYDILERAASRTGLGLRRMRGIWGLEAKAITAAEYILIKDVYDARFAIEQSKLSDQQRLKAPTISSGHQAPGGLLVTERDA